MSKTPVAVLVSDVHYNINTLEVADKAMRLAIDKANDLKVRLIVCGDLHDTKAHLRGECVSSMIDTFLLCKTPTYVLVGNHDKINEKSAQHSLDFLKAAFVNVIDKITYIPHTTWTLVPYQHDIEALKYYLKTVPGSNLIMHQGIQGSNSGEYFQDKSALHPEDVAGFRVISGHYHTRQTIALPDGGSWDFVGNPFTLGFGEANDPPKGFQVLYDDGSLEFIPTNLRKHRIIEIDLNSPNAKASMGRVDDILWFKIKGTQEQLAKFNKQSFKEQNPHFANFKLELILDEQTSDKTVEPVSQTKGQVLDGLIDSLTNTTVIQKQRLKTLWKDFV